MHKCVFIFGDKMYKVKVESINLRINEFSQVSDG